MTRITESDDSEPHSNTPLDTHTDMPPYIPEDAETVRVLSAAPASWAPAEFDADQCELGRNGADVALYTDDKPDGVIMWRSDASNLHHDTDKKYGWYLPTADHLEFE